jgi:hypothetical protein
MSTFYDADVEVQMRNLFHSLNEKDRRRYAAIEATKLGHGGISYIAGLFGCHPDTITQGKRDLQNLPRDESGTRVRKKGAAGQMLAKASRASSKLSRLKSRRKQLDRRFAKAKSGRIADCG